MFYKINTEFKLHLKEILNQNLNILISSYITFRAFQELS